MDLLGKKIVDQSIHKNSLYKVKHVINPDLDMNVEWFRRY